MMIWSMLILTILLKISYDFFIKQKERQTNNFNIRRNIFKKEIKEELKKEMKNGRNTKRR